MKATDLMIGDWVLHNGKPIQVYNVFNGSINETYYGISNEVDDYIPESEIDSIPLTPEILEKNGIKLSYTYTHPYRDGGWEECELEEARKHYPMYVYKTLNPSITFVIRPNEQELKVFSFNYKTSVEKKEEVIFVNELQHALKLCGIEKEIIL